ncbi:hypothetical protein C8R45DRAFT_934165 [Mycena sanguinolenta]|nr:hypothetical protein C8R45DRAFT_934165 [Mycena sanguinolenta]
MGFALHECSGAGKLKATALALLFARTMKDDARSMISRVRLDSFQFPPAQHHHLLGLLRRRAPTQIQLHERLSMRDITLEKSPSKVGAAALLGRNLAQLRPRPSTIVRAWSVPALRRALESLTRSTRLHEDLSYRRRRDPSHSRSRYHSALCFRSGNLKTGSRIRSRYRLRVRGRRALSASFDAGCESAPIVALLLPHEHPSAGMLNATALLLPITSTSAHDRRRCSFPLLSPVDAAVRHRVRLDYARAAGLRRSPKAARAQAQAYLTQRRARRPAISLPLPAALQMSCCGRLEQPLRCRLRAFRVDDVLVRIHTSSLFALSGWEAKMSVSASMKAASESASRSARGCFLRQRRSPAGLMHPRSNPKLRPLLWGNMSWGSRLQSSMFKVYQLLDYFVRLPLFRLCGGNYEDKEEEKACRSTACSRGGVDEDVEDRLERVEVEERYNVKIISENSKTAEAILQRSYAFEGEGGPAPASGQGSIMTPPTMYERRRQRLPEILHRGTQALAQHKRWKGKGLWAASCARTPAESWLLEPSRTSTVLELAARKLIELGLHGLSSAEVVVRRAAQLRWQVGGSRRHDRTVQRLRKSGMRRWMMRTLRKRGARRREELEQHFRSLRVIVISRTRADLNRRWAGYWRGVEWNRNWMALPQRCEEYRVPAVPGLIKATSTLCYVHKSKSRNTAQIDRRTCSAARAAPPDPVPEVQNGAANVNQRRVKCRVSECPENGRDLSGRVGASITSKGKDGAPSAHMKSGFSIFSVCLLFRSARDWRRLTKKKGGPRRKLLGGSCFGVTEQAAA